MSNINATQCTTSDITNKRINEAVEYKDPTEFGKGYAAPLVHNYSYEIKSALKYLDDEKTRNIALRELKEYVSRLEDIKESVENFNEYWKERYPACIDYIDEQTSIIPKDILDEISANESLKENLDSSHKAVGFARYTSKKEA